MQGVDFEDKATACMPLRAPLRAQFLNILNGSRIDCSISCVTSKRLDRCVLQQQRTIVDGIMTVSLSTHRRYASGKLVAFAFAGPASNVWKRFRTRRICRWINTLLLVVLIALVFRG